MRKVDFHNDVKPEKYSRLSMARLHMIKEYLTTEKVVL